MKQAAKSPLAWLSTKRVLHAFFFWLAVLFLWELTIHTAAYDDLSHFFPAVLFTCAAALIVSALTTLPTIAGRIVAWVLPPVLCLIYCVQLVYYYIFSAFLSLAFVSVGGEAITEFLPFVLSAIGDCLPRLLLLILPVAGFYVLRRFGFLIKENPSIKMQLILIACGLVITCGAALGLPLGGTGIDSPYAAWHSPTAAVDRWADRFGLLTTEFLDLRRLILGNETSLGDGGLDLTVVSSSSGNSSGDVVVDDGNVTVDVAPPERNIMEEMDFDVLSRQTDNETILELTNYFSTQSGTNKNAYTGMFEDYNLILICAEAFSPYLIDPEITPTLYRLSTEGFVFNNFYNSFPSVTTDGEYSLCMGLMTDTSRVSFAASKDNYLPFCLGREFASAGTLALAYHNNIATFYNRINTHTNMGYQFKAINFGLDMEIASPASDLEMMEKTVDDFIGQEPFHAYYMTYSGHAFYNFEDNDMCVQNESLVTDIQASEPVRAYYACQLELERALTYLLERLEEAGIADRTVIALTGDHMPYGLPDDAYMELAGDAVSEPFWRNRNGFLCWSASMEEPIVVDNYGCTQDVLPTLLNLFGISYDSRLLTGRDLLSDCVHVALLKNGSFLTQDVVYDSRTGEVTWRNEEAADDNYAMALLQAVNDQFTIAAAILDCDYYGYAFSTLGLINGPVEHPHFSSFADISDTWYEDDVELLTGRGVLAGDKSGDFHGEAAIERVALIAMVVRWLQLTDTGTSDFPYTDVDPDNWSYTFVARAWAAGLLPADETTLRPTDRATGPEAASLFYAAAQHAGLRYTQKEVEQLVADTLAAQVANNPELTEDVLTRGSAASILAAFIYESDPTLKADR